MTYQSQRRAVSAYVRAQTEVFHLDRFDNDVPVELVFNSPIARGSTRPPKGAMIYVQATGTNRETKKPEVMEYFWLLGIDEYNNTVVVKAFGSDVDKISSLANNDLIMLENHALGSHRGLYEYNHYVTGETTIELLGKRNGEDVQNEKENIPPPPPTAPAGPLKEPAHATSSPTATHSVATQTDAAQKNDSTNEMPNQV